jgi:spermidine synthase
VIGLGVGTLAVYAARPGDTIRFYEINSEDLRLAEKYFTYLSDARSRGAEVEIVLGDGRLSLERELAQPQEFDVLVLDGFTSDSPPPHLLTKEAFDIYIPHLAPEGAIAVNISNRYFNLAPVVYGLAEKIGLEPFSFFSPDGKPTATSADWVILSRNQGLFETLRAAGDENLAGERPKPPLPVWTDQRHNLLEVIGARKQKSRPRHTDEPR